MQLLEVDGHEFEMTPEDYEALARELNRVNELPVPSEQFFFKFQNHEEIVVLNKNFAYYLLEFLYGKNL